MIESLNAVADLWWGRMSAVFWQVSLLIVLIACIDRVIRKWAWPQLRYALWSLVLLKLILPPTLSLPSGLVPTLRPMANQTLGWLDSEKPVPIEDCESRIADSTVHPNTRSVILTSPRIMGGYVEATPAANPKSAIPNPQLPTLANPQSKIPNPKLAWSFHAMVIWLAGMLTLGIWLLLRLRSFVGQDGSQAAAASLPQSFYNRMADCAKRLGLRRVPRVVVTRRVPTPAVFGVFRPVLLMPKGYLCRLSGKDIEHMLLHELAHIKRGDLLMHSLYILLQIMHWYNPLLWLVRRQLRHLRELSCDATVAELLREQTGAYRQTLLETARRFLARSTEPGLGLLGLFENSNRLVVRLSWLEKPTWRYKTMKRITVITLTALMFACVLPMAQGQDNAPVVVKEEPSKDTKQDAQRSRELAELRAKLATLEAERLELQKQLQALATSREAIAEVKELQVQNVRTVSEAEKVAGAAQAEKAKIQAWAERAQQWQQSQAMQQWQEAMEQWQQSEAFKQWQKDVQKWGTEYGKKFEKAYRDGEQPADAPAMPAMPPMPAMPAAPVEVVAPAPPRVAPQTFPPSEPREFVVRKAKPPKVKVPEVVVPMVEVPEVVVAPGSTAGAMPPPAKDDQWIEAGTQGEYLVKSLHSGATFVVQNRLGSVRIVTGQGPGATIKATVTAKGMTKQEAQAIAEKVEIRITPTTDFVKVDAKLPDDIDEAGRERIQVAFEVAVPPEVNVQIAQKVGSIHLAGLRAEVKVTNEVGDIYAEDVIGDLSLRTNVGNIAMIVPSDLSAKVDASARVGSVQSDLPLNITGAAVVQAGKVRSALGSSATGVLGSGEEKIRLDVNVGSIRIQSSEKSSQQTTF